MMARRIGGRDWKRLFYKQGVATLGSVTVEFGLAMYAVVLLQGFGDADTRGDAALPTSKILEDEAVELGTVAHGIVSQRDMV